MHVALFHGDFKNTTIKTAFEQMRANAIINAESNERGLSVIHFNLPTFLTSKRKDDLLFILENWAIQPIKKEPERFIYTPAEGQKALEHRSHRMIQYLLERKDISENMAQDLSKRTSAKISTEIECLRDVKTA